VARSPLNRALDRQLLAYAGAAAAAGVSALALVQPSAAEIIYTPAQQKIPHGGSITLDLNHDGVTDFTIHSKTGCSITFNCVYQALSVSPNQQNRVVGGPGSLNAYPLALYRNQKIGPSATFLDERQVMDRCINTRSGDVTYPRGYWLRQESGAYLGLKFYIGGEVHYGWARMKVTVNAFTCNAQALLTGYAYETVPNRPILAGQGSGAAEADRGANLGSLATGAANVEARKREDGR
jgi:hypothetical protein